MKIKFLPYPGMDRWGVPCVYSCSSLDESDLRAMLKQPRHLKVVEFRVGHSLWAKRLVWILDHASDGTKSEFIGKGFVRALASMGYRIVPSLDEILANGIKPRSLAEVEAALGIRQMSGVVQSSGRTENK